MIERDGQRLLVKAPMLIGTARVLSEAGAALLPDGEAIVDLSAVADADSSALAVLFSWARVQQARAGSLRVEGAPRGVAALADMYGVADLISIS